MYCFVCANNFFYWNKKHTLNINGKTLYVNVCRKCKNAQCYAYSKCSIDSLGSVCADCIEEDKSDLPIEIDKLPPSISPITTQCDKDKVLNIHNIVPSLW